MKGDDWKLTVRCPQGIREVKRLLSVLCAYVWIESVPDVEELQPIRVTVWNDDSDRDDADSGGRPCLDSQHGLCRGQCGLQLLKG
jgi:hypothetical protein